MLFHFHCNPSNTGNFSLAMDGSDKYPEYIYWKYFETKLFTLKIQT